MSSWRYADPLMLFLYRDAYLSLRHHRDAAHVRVTRSELQFGSVNRVASSLRECSKALRDLDVSRLGLLLDWRLAPLTTNPVLLKHVVQQTDTFAAAFARRALLVATPIGLLQSERLGRTIHHAKPVLFTDEAEAVAYARGEHPGGVTEG
jgi:hypothetical protein